MSQPKLDRIVEEFGDRIEVVHHIVPVFGSVPWRLREGAWAKGGVEGRVEVTRRIAVEHQREDIRGTCWHQDCPASSWSPGVAVKAVSALEAKELAPRGSAAEYLRRLRERFFVDEQNVARRAVQLHLAEEQRLDRAALERELDDGSALAALWEDYQRKEELRIKGSPTYVFDGGRAMLYGSFPFGILRATVEELVRGATTGGSHC